MRKEDLEEYSNYLEQGRIKYRALKIIGTKADKKYADKMLKKLDQMFITALHKYYLE